MLSRKTFLPLACAATVLALAGPASADPAKPTGGGAGGGPAPLAGTGDPGRIDGQYIVVLDKGADDAKKAKVEKKAKDRGAKIKHSYGKALKGFAATLTPDALEEIRNDPDVAFVEADSTMTASATQSPTPSWGLDRIDQRALPLNSAFAYTPTGSGVTAYIIDTGIRRTHSDFGGRAVVGTDTVGDGQNTNDCNGHGTHVAGTVGGSAHGVAKSVRLIAVRVLNCSGSGSTSGVIAGVDWVTSHHLAGGPAVANMSLGGGVSSALDTAVANSIADGISYSVAAGNSNADACNTSPARTPTAITVGATTNTDARASFSNYGTCLDTFGPGQSITSAWSTGDTATNTISGTSMAAPHVAGVAALYLQGSPGAAPATVRDAIVSTSTTGVVTNPGAGSPNRLVYSPLTGSAPPPPPPSCGTTYTGSLSGTGAVQYQPNGSYYYSGVSGTHKGCLTGPAGTDFDLYLQKWNGSTWVNVASGIGYTSTETVTYSGTSGYYRWRVVSYSGSGAYQLQITRP